MNCQSYSQHSAGAEYRDKKLSYLGETARQLPTWRGLGPLALPPLPHLATPMHTVES